MTLRIILTERQRYVRSALDHRPQRAEHVAIGLGLSRSEVLEDLNRLEAIGQAERIARAGRVSGSRWLGWCRR